MSREKKNFGDWGEELAAGFLKRQGFEIIERNYHTVFGEIDIVAKKGGDFYFIEVKARRAGALANDLAITGDKKRKMERTIKAYCYSRNIPGDVGLVSAGLLAVWNEEKRIMSFRLAVFI